MQNESEVAMTLANLEQTKNIKDLLQKQASILSLITQFSMRPCPKLAQFIVQHLRLLVEHPNARDNQELYQDYLKLLSHWVEIGQYLIEQRKPNERQKHTVMH
jgi:hypothetical protein